MSDSPDKEPGPDEPSPETKDASGGPWSAIFRGRLPLESETAWYVLVSVLDVIFTYLLLRQSAQPGARLRLYESNPIARTILNLYGMKGMIYFKFILVGIVVVIAQVIATKKLHVARYLLWFASAVVGAVVLYSAYLLFLATRG